MLWVKQGEKGEKGEKGKKGGKGENGEKEKNGTLSSAELVTAPSSPDESAVVPWSRRLNPMKTNKIPAIPEQRQPSNEHGANWFSRLTFYWVQPILSVGYQRPLEQNDIWLVNPDRSIHVLESRFEVEFQNRVAAGNKRPLLGALFATFKTELLWGALCQLLTIVAQNGSPYVLKYLIAFSDDAFSAQKSGDAGPSLGRGVGLVCGITGLQILMTFAINHFFYWGNTTGGEIRAVLMSQIFAKAMKLSGRARVGTVAESAPPPSTAKPGSEEGKKWYSKALPSKKDKPAKGKKPSPGGRPGGPPGDDEDSDGWSNGRIVNLMSTDTHRIDQACGFLQMVWGSPLSILVTMALLIVNLSYSAVPGVALLFFTSPVLAKTIRSLFKRRFAISRITDQRVSLTSEILQSIRFVKFFGWEAAFLERIDKIRLKEIRSIQKILAIRDGVQAIALSIPVFASMLSFITYALTNNVLNPAPIFSSLSLFNNLRMPMNMLPMVMGQVVDAFASIGRIQEFFLAEESTEDVVVDPQLEHAVVLNDASFTWERTKKQNNDNTENARPGTAIESVQTLVEPFHIPGLNLTAGRDELIGIIGGVGSGKTSLLAALAGDMRKTSGSVTFGASRAFCPQYAWLQNASVRENITFGKAFDRAWYNKVTEACALRADFEMLPSGDKTEIGERGITVSGGQKQRINIARAIYFNAEIVLMDDPLSAVDAHVGRHIMDEAICGLLKGKCRVLATHQLHVLHRCDRVIWMDAGCVKAQGTYEDLMAQNEEFAQLMTLTSTKEEEAENDDVDAKSINKPDIKEKLAKVETAKTAKSGKSAVALMQEEERATKAVSGAVYGTYLTAGGNVLVPVFIIVMLALSQASNILTSLWLSWWVSNQFRLNTGEWIGIYAGLGGGQALAMFLFAVSISVFGTRASRVMFKKAMYRVLRAPMSFFDTTPLGRITNRFSKDVDVMDNALTDSVRMYLLTLGQMLATFALVLVYFWYFIAAIVPLCVVFLIAAWYYRASAREIKRHEAILRSDVFSKFSEAVYGTTTIRAYGTQDQFLKTIRERIDEFNGAYYLTFANQRWLSLRLDYIGIIMVFVLGMLVVTSRFSIDPSTAGLVLSYMLSIMGTFQFVVRQMAEVENDMNNTERIHHYGTKLEQEAPEIVGEVPTSWPQAGEIIFDHVQLRYRAGLPLVLKDISVHIKGGERLGVVGRTGAGKSSIMQALFRLVELSGGSVTIDGINISTIGLHDLRSRLAIIPQDPTLFRGTVRSNLDPFNEHTDAELWEALRQSHLSGGEGGGGGVGLETAVEEEGMNFSLGQRQLMALARALVRDAKIIVCNEATSSVDFATDQKVQATMEAFKGKTLLCIAHRLKTIIEYDRICVMDQGRVAELGTPLELFDQGGIFQGMCEKSGLRREDILRKTSGASSTET